jgi:4,5-DOPA dioxygenase extradiol
MTHALPVLFLSHGSPMTAIEPGELGAVWQSLGERLPRPRAVLMVSAHWTTRVPMVSGAADPQTVHDFGGFPEALYRLQYAAPGAPQLAQTVKALLTERGIATGIDATRGLDHGAWVPLRILFPQADIPVLQLSVQPERCARHHFAVGAALAPLTAQGVLIVGSGHLTHNLGEWLRGAGGSASPQTVAFRDWTHARLLAGDTEALLDWPHAAPHAAFAHPTPEHFLPLFVALGAAGARHRTESLGGGYVGALMAADNYLFAQAGQTPPA